MINKLNYLDKILNYKSLTLVERMIIESIKDTLLKAQDQEKLIIELCEYYGMNNLYPYNNLEEIEITFKDTFDNYQLQRIKSLERLDKQNKVIEIIKKKNIDVYVLKTCINLEHYNSEIRLKNQNNTYSYEIWYELTKEEFDLLKIFEMKEGN